MNIAIVEDEPKLALLLQQYMEREGYTTVLYDDGSVALEKMQHALPDLILLDLMLPGTDGLTICRELRKTSQVPIIMLTARVEEIDRLLGLEIGADDYICKPYSPREVVARTRAVLRRSSLHDPVPVHQEFVLEEDLAVVRIHGEESSLTAVELQLLKVMYEHPGRIFSRSQLMGRIYPDNRIVENRTIDSHIKKLRHKLLALDSTTEYIRSVYGIGYKFEKNPLP